MTMMLNDIVVDTNVFVHASNPNVPFHATSLALLRVLGDATVVLCVDEGFDIVEAQNRSLIAGEYYGNLISGMVGFAIIATLASTGRLKQVPKRVPQAVAQKIRRLVPRNPRDRTFLRVSFNSHERILVSHDFDDFGPGVRTALKASVSVAVITAEDVIVLLS